MVKTFCCLLLICTTFYSNAQKYPPGKILRITSNHSMFPDSLRNVQPRVYGGKTYTAAEHYSDSSVFIFVPDYFDKTKYFEFVFWFHGWNNNIDSALSQFQLLEQFYAAHQNAIFVFPEGPKNAPDSYGGKLEKGNGFFKLYTDIVNALFIKLGIEKVFAPIVLAGHSGAYRVMGKISETLPHRWFPKIFLFDALYGEIESYLTYAKSQFKLINIYTDDGGTKQNSLDFLKTLDSLHIPYLHKEEDEVTTKELKSNNIIFLHSKKGHNEVITSNRNFERFLSTPGRQEPTTPASGGQ